MMSLIHGVRFPNSGSPDVIVWAQHFLYLLSKFIVLLSSAQKSEGLEFASTGLLHLFAVPVLCLLGYRSGRHFRLLSKSQEQPPRVHPNAGLVKRMLVPCTRFDSPLPVIHPCICFSARRLPILKSSVLAFVTWNANH